MQQQAWLNCIRLDDNELFLNCNFFIVHVAVAQSYKIILLSKLTLLVLLLLKQKAQGQEVFFKFLLTFISLTCNDPYGS